MSGSVVSPVGRLNTNSPRPVVVRCDSDAVGIEATTLTVVAASNVRDSSDSTHDAGDAKAGRASPFFRRCERGIAIHSKVYNDEQIETAEVCLIRARGQ